MALNTRPWFCPKRPPDQIIGTDGDYMLRWFLIPKNRLFNVYLHNFLKDDDPRALHDHPWHSVSFMLRGKTREIMKGGSRILRASLRPIFRSASFAHRIEVIEPAWTLFLTGPIVRQWGFHCPRGWRHWKLYCNPIDSGKVGRGCE